MERESLRVQNKATKLNTIICLTAVGDQYLDANDLEKKMIKEALYYL